MNTILPAKPDSLMSYVCRLTRNISINRFKYNHRKRRDSSYALCLEEWEECLSDAGELDETVSDADIEKLINGFVSRLSDTDRMIFIRRFWYFDPYEKIAALTGIGEGAIRMRVARMKKRLKERLLKKGVIV